MLPFVLHQRHVNLQRFPANLEDLEFVLHLGSYHGEGFRHHVARLAPPATRYWCNSSNNGHTEHDEVLLTQAVIEAAGNGKKCPKSSSKATKKQAAEEQPANNVAMHIPSTQAAAPASMLRTR